MKTTDPPIIVESTLAGNLQQAWEAITVHDKMIEWYFQNIPDFQARVGFHTEFPVQSGARTFTHIWDVTEVIPQQKISYHWTYTEYPGESKVSFELLPEGDAIKVRLTNIVLRDFPQDVPEFKRESCIAGWRYFIQQQLTDYMLKYA